MLAVAPVIVVLAMATLVPVFLVRQIMPRQS
ncbi:hypothetical protein NK6_9534 [Bradyrhizobium diazoefficiens]|jgi:hypothetical protein|uniref:Uncharacterized protein n=1 Tax=Bradyrhizobium diazoefficiens TaxID=1355477 RepID=A0A0E4BXM5_9BRAD|nr:hypothetical protein NK6_9534 [Bradyrhizobium diazoefficiens]